MVRTQATGRDFDDIVVRVNQIMDNVLHRSFFRFPPGKRWQPAINFYETQHAYYICLDLAGVDPKQIDLQVEGNVLRISGHRPTPSPQGIGNARLHIMEIDHGAFQRSIQIPPGVNNDMIKARQINGMVWVEMPIE